MLYFGGFLAKLGLFAGFSLYTINFAGKNSKAAMGREHYFFRLGGPVKGYTGAHTWIFRDVFINFAGTSSEAAMGRAGGRLDF